MGNHTYAEEGGLKISDDVIATIANTAAADVRGVAGFSIYPIKDLKGFAKHKPNHKAIHTEMKEGEVVLDLYVNLYLGAYIPDVAAELQSRVKDAVQTMTGMAVS